MTTRFTIRDLLIATVLLSLAMGLPLFALRQAHTLPFWLAGVIFSFCPVFLFAGLGKPIDKAWDGLAIGLVTAAPWFFLGWPLAKAMFDAAAH